jgi:hypothetical protein
MRGEQPFKPKVAMMRAVYPDYALDDDVSQTLRDFDERQHQETILRQCLDLDQDLSHCLTQRAEMAPSNSDSYSELSGVAHQSAEVDQYLRAAFAQNAPVTESQLLDEEYRDYLAEYGQVDSHASSPLLQSPRPIAPESSVAVTKTITPKSPKSPSVTFPTSSAGDKVHEEADKINAHSKRSLGTADDHSHKSSNLPRVDARLEPWIPDELRPHFRDGVYQPTPAEVEQMSTFFNKTASLISLVQGNDETHFICSPLTTRYV